MKGAVMLALLSCCVTGNAAEVVPVPAPEAARWLDHLIPLPKEISVQRAVRLPAGEVVVSVPEAAGPAAQRGAELLRAALAGPEGAPAATGSFQIRLALADAGSATARRLSELRNSDQAYTIAPEGDQALVLTALADQGLYYAALTVRDLIAARAEGGVVTIPLLTVTDWPDLAERGLWGGNSANDIEWMAAHKMNLVETHVRLGVDEQGRGTAAVSAQMLELARSNALKLVPIVPHLEQIESTGIFERLPQTAGRGDPEKWAKSGHVRPACWSQPDTVRVLGDWMVALAGHEGVTDLCVWLSENAVKCECEQCADKNQFALETAAILAGYERARQVKPDLGLRILLTQGSYESNELVLSMVPPGVGVTYYHGGKTYDSSRDPMIYPLLEQWAARGNWLGCYPQLTASWRIVCPWSGPQFIRYRMTEFVDKGLSCLCGYATPNNRLYEFNIAAAAEWSWNAHGRDETQFARAFFTRRGLADPEAAAEWAVTLGPVGWDIYGGRIPYYWVYGSAAASLEARRAPTLGTGWYRYLETPERFEEDLAAVARATEIAQRLDDPLLIVETKVIGGYLTMLKMFYDMSVIVASPQPPTEEQRQQLNEQMYAMAQAAADAADGLQAWESTCGGGIGGSRLLDTIDCTERAARAAGKALRPFGIQDPGALYVQIVAGKWTEEDFVDSRRITKIWEVTEAVSGADVYEARFNYRSGWHGLHIHRAALACAPADAPDNRTELVVDQHDGAAAATNRDNVYRLKLDQYDPNLRYFLVAEITGTPNTNQPANRRNCRGDVTFRRVRAPGQPLPRLPLLPAEQAATRTGPVFTGAGIKVGVVQGGYGSESLLRHLGGIAGTVVQPLYHLTPDFLGRCQVVVLPQARLTDSFPASALEPLQAFVRAGGGLMTTHDAVGFRGLPILCPEVCAGGVEKVRDTHWRVCARHPVTAGLPDGPLSMGYYDFIGLQPGPAGLTVAVGDPSGVPAVVCGELGQGRYVACGMAIGISGPAADESPPTEHEAQLLSNAIRWLARA